MNLPFSRTENLIYYPNLFFFNLPTSSLLACSLLLFHLTSIQHVCTEFRKTQCVACHNKIVHRHFYRHKLRFGVSRLEPNGKFVPCSDYKAHATPLMVLMNHSKAIKEFIDFLDESFYSWFVGSIIT